MQKVLLDSHMISYFLHGEPSVITELEKYHRILRANNILHTHLVTKLLAV
jgi:hypothetical protein